MLKLTSTQDYHAEILVRAAKHSEQNDRIPEAIKLYNLAGDYGTVISCLASALGTTVSRPAPDEKSKAIEKTAVDILRHYERTNRAVGRDREAVTKLLRIREAMNAKEAGRPEVALEVRSWVCFLHHGAQPSQIMESTNLIPLDGDMSRVTRKAEEFKEYHDALQRNLPTYLTLTMDALSGVHQKTKVSLVPDSARQMVCSSTFTLLHPLIPIGRPLVS